MRDRIKAIAGTAVGTMAPQCSYSRCIFLLAHMRCGSTALSNILCSRADISGYGEAHIRYDGQGALGRLLVNQALRRSWSPRAPYLFDKILHARHDSAAPAEFFQARAIFVARAPAAAIRSIRALYAALGREEYSDDATATDYYIARMQALAALWDRFPPDRRVGLTHRALLKDPLAELARISTALDLDPPLRNSYRSPSASHGGGAGDPLTSGRFDSIQPRAGRQAPDATLPLDIPRALRDRAELTFARFRKKIEQG